MSEPHPTPIPVCLTFDVDADESWRYRRPASPETLNLSQLSWGRYGIARGLPRILQSLEELDVHATFFVPGATARAHPQAIEQIASAGHEIGHHGYHHFPPAQLSDEDQREELERGLETLTAQVGTPPIGYRAPAWQMTATTFKLVAASGFLYDSSMMADDRPYLEQVDDTTLIEIPVHWALDDVPHLAAIGDEVSFLHDPRQVFDAWWREVDSAIEEQRPTSFCFHPEVIGRGWTFGPFRQFLHRLRHDKRVQLRRCADVARTVRETNSARPPAREANS